jgi:hypothetical protein
LTRKFCQPFCNLPEDTLSIWQKGGETPMAVYTIIRVYEVPADSRIRATERMIEAICLGVEKDFHVKDILRDPAQPGEKPGKGTAVKLAPAAGWLTLLIQQLTGK